MANYLRNSVPCNKRVSNPPPPREAAGRALPVSPLRGVPVVRGSLCITFYFRRTLNCPEAFVGDDGDEDVCDPGTAAGASLHV